MPELSKASLIKALRDQDKYHHTNNFLEQIHKDLSNELI